MAYIFVRKCAQQCLEQGKDKDTIEQLAQFVGEFVEDRSTQWIKQQGGWLPFTRGYNLRRHIERVHKHRHGDLEMYGGGSKKGEGKRQHDSSDEGSYDDISQSDTNDSASEPLEEDDMTDSSETDDSDADSDTEGADSSEGESSEDDTVTDNDGEEDDGSENVCCPIDTWEALAHMNKAMTIILKREFKKATDSAS
ncbi:hypothetical protein HOLleu_33748 [Holothuria leucospilota]|uniref:Bcl-2 Bcl-2 homology region 1-3 domain-containing protein n=1 Tax=Holothuria leucospilota TaxID=206669 RepID=A0A9Q0YP71_HOLLE|nr:hypothetical protein HOLleu_33748 [Holothuria leucospilota]